MDRHFTYNSCVADHGEYVKLQYGRKIAQDTWMLATMKTPDWSQAPPGFICKNNTIPCTVTTNSSNSSLKMYPYSDTQRCNKVRQTCSRHRCLSGSTAQCFPHLSPDALALQRALLRSHIMDSAGIRCCAAQSVHVPLSQYVSLYPTSVEKISQFRSLSNNPHANSLASHIPSSLHHHHHHHHHPNGFPPTACVPTHSILETQQFLSGLELQPYRSPSHYRTLILNPEFAQHH